MATGTQLEKSAPLMHGQPQLTDRLAGLWGRARVGWAGMQPAQRGWMLVAALLLAALVGGLFWYGLRPDWRILYADMDRRMCARLARFSRRHRFPLSPLPTVPASWCLPRNWTRRGC